MLPSAGAGAGAGAGADRQTGNDRIVITNGVVTQLPSSWKGDGEAIIDEIIERFSLDTSLCFKLNISASREEQVVAADLFESIMQSALVAIVQETIDGGHRGIGDDVHMSDCRDLKKVCDDTDCNVHEIATNFFNAAHNALEKLKITSPTNPQVKTPLSKDLYYELSEQFRMFMRSLAFYAERECGEDTVNFHFKLALAIRKCIADQVPDQTSPALDLAELYNKDKQYGRARRALLRTRNHLQRIVEKEPGQAKALAPDIELLRTEIETLNQRIKNPA